ncbi:Eukaryotic translation initiation factor 5 [Astathelohania contejeani]|uniref:Eukaryotic translation initiation factor 5 n=1 Tax=Astathelohania contejeani TaxID=164912 RepID=A0ABQ7I1T9_9MICR|nr:Eukaryotic translation initiation factor 5 [Thelohania contejeani]
MLININPNTNDPFYRYKMPKPTTAIEGRGNGIKTIITNLDAIGQALNRSPVYILKHLSYELGSQSKNDAKKYSINGSHETSKIQDKIYGFIKLYVICTGCDNPETEFINDRGLKKSCFACGHKDKVEGNSKLINFILKDYDFTNKKSMYSNEPGVSEQVIITSPKYTIPKESKHIYEIFKNGIDNNEDVNYLTNFLKEFGKNKFFEVFETFLVQENIENIKDLIARITGIGLTKKGEIWKYFQGKSKVLNKEDGKRIRDKINEYFK